MCDRKNELDGQRGRDYRRSCQIFDYGKSIKRHEYNEHADILAVQYPGSTTRSGGIRWCTVEEETTLSCIY